MYILFSNLPFFIGMSEGLTQYLTKQQKACNDSVSKISENISQAFKIFLTMEKNEKSTGNVLKVAFFILKNDYISNLTSRQSVKLFRLCSQASDSFNKHFLTHISNCFSFHSIPRNWELSIIQHVFSASLPSITAAPAVQLTATT